MYLLCISSQAAHLTDVAISVSVLGLLAIKGAHDIETRLNEVEKLLETVISMPCKVSRTARVAARVARDHQEGSSEGSAREGRCLWAPCLSLFSPGDRVGRRAMRCEAGGDRGFSRSSGLCSLPSPQNPLFLLRFRTGSQGQCEHPRWQPSVQLHFSVQ